MRRSRTYDNQGKKTDTNSIKPLCLSSYNRTQMKNDIWNNEIRFSKNYGSLYMNTVT